MSGSGVLQALRRQGITALMPLRGGGGAPYPGSAYYAPTKPVSNPAYGGVVCGPLSAPMSGQSGQLRICSEQHMLQAWQGNLLRWAACDNTHVAEFHTVKRDSSVCITSMVHQ
jgi:hypothetical protein